jgi:hypothetical protein
VLEHLDGKRFIYKRKDGLEFKLKRYNGTTWITLQEGDTMRMDGRDFKLIEITPTSITVEEIAYVSKKEPRVKG